MHSFAESLPSHEWPLSPALDMWSLEGSRAKSRGTVCIDLGIQLSPVLTISGLTASPEAEEMWFFNLSH